jgi:hypothetical protein
MHMSNIRNYESKYVNSNLDNIVPHSPSQHKVHMICGLRCSLALGGMCVCGVTCLHMCRCDNICLYNS